MPLREQLTTLFEKDLHPFPFHSRIHPLNHPFSPSTRWSIKRDDELSLGISGSKLRKALSLLPYLERKGIKHVLMEGSGHSNFLLGFSQLLIERGITPHALITPPKGNPKGNLRGNLLLTQLFIKKEHIYPLISREEDIASKLQTIESTYQEKAYFLPEGGGKEALGEGLLGALTLPYDIVEQEHTPFDHIFVDAGSGLTAIALLLGLRALNHPAHLHIVLMAGTEAAFLQELKRGEEEFTKRITPLLSPLSGFTLYTPPTARSYGSTNRAVWDEVKRVASSEGILLDPIYSAKLFLSAKEIAERGIEGHCLLIHSGGALSLMGFQEKLLS